MTQEIRTEAVVLRSVPANFPIEPSVELMQRSLGAERREAIGCGGAFRGYEDAAASVARESLTCTVPRPDVNLRKMQDMA